MDNKPIPVQVDLKREIHGALKVKCAVEGVTMKAKIIELIEKWVEVKNA